MKLRPRRPILLVSFCAGLTVGAASRAQAANPEPPKPALPAPPREMKDDDVRAFLKGQGEGSLSNPMKLDSEAAVAKVCEELEGPRRAAASEGDAYERGLQRHELKLRAKAAQRSVYRIRVAPGGFKVGDYRYERNRLPLKLDQHLIALDGAATLSVIRPKGGTFELAPDQAKQLAQQIDQKHVALDVVFRIDADPRGLGGCFTYQKSAASNLQIEPLSFALVDPSSNKVLAGATTPAMKQLQAWLDPGKARLELAVQGVEGPVDAEQLRAAVEAKRGAIEACLKPVIESAHETALLGYAVKIAPSGSLESIHREAEAIDQESVSPCVDRALASVSTAKMPKASIAHVAIRVDRALAEGDEPQPEL